METYYYDGQSFDRIDDLMVAVKHDVDFSLGDSDFDKYLRGNGGVSIDGNAFNTSLALKRYSCSIYREIREEVVNLITTEVRSNVISGIFPLQVPFTFNVIESSE